MDIPGLPQRITAKIQLDESTGCWIWTGATFVQGYGQLWLSGRKWKVHRLTYTVLVRELSEAEVLDHLCRQRACCNPAHLEPVSLAENSRRARQGSERCPKGHVKERLRGQWMCHQCEVEYKREQRRDPAYQQRERERQREPKHKQRKAAWAQLKKRRPGPGQAPLF